jgi:hypothetical protein
LADKLRGNDKIKQVITLHGATKAVHVDTARKNFKVARNHLYRDYDRSLFYSRKPNIDYDKLKTEREQEIKQGTREQRNKSEEVESHYQTKSTLYINKRRKSHHLEQPYARVVHNHPPFAH